MTAEQIAAGLTKAQREAVLLPIGRVAVGADVILDLLCSGVWAVGATELGLEVRRILQETPND